LGEKDPGSKISSMSKFKKTQIVETIGQNIESLEKVLFRLGL
jgi:hypothetical protein